MSNGTQADEEDKTMSEVEISNIHTNGNFFWCDASYRGTNWRVTNRGGGKGNTWGISIIPNNGPRPLASGSYEGLHESLMEIVDIVDHMFPDGNEGDEPSPKYGDLYRDVDGEPMPVVAIVNNGDGMACRALDASRAVYVSVDEIEAVEIYTTHTVWATKEM